MPFLKGRAALRRTKQWLERGEIMLKDNVQIVTFGYGLSKRHGMHHDGLEKFLFWHLAQLRYKNPSVQFVTFKYISPTPWIKVYLDDDTQAVVDCDSRSRAEIHDHMLRVFGKTKEILEKEVQQRESRLANPANFGASFDRHCICVMPGQLPCPGFKELPKSMQGKWSFKLKTGEITKEELDEMDAQVKAKTDLN